MPSLKISPAPNSNQLRRRWRSALRMRPQCALVPRVSQLVPARSATPMRSLTAVRVSAVLIVRRPHHRAQRRVDTEQENRPGMARGGLARRGVFDCEVRIEGSRVRHSSGLRPHRFSRGVARSSRRRMGGPLLDAPQEVPSIEKQTEDVL